jgi:uncharacterized protein (TIGR00369 family)
MPAPGLDHTAVTHRPPFALLLGAKIIDVTTDRLVAELIVREELLNRNGHLHGGALMGVADSLGGTATAANIDESQFTSTIESKTNFFRSIPAGDRVRFVCTLLHGGRKTMVWQTNVYRSDEKLAATVIQTQILLPRGE